MDTPERRTMLNENGQTTMQASHLDNRIDCDDSHYRCLLVPTLRPEPGGTDNLSLLAEPSLTFPAINMLKGLAALYFSPSYQLHFEALVAHGTYEQDLWLEICEALSASLKLLTSP